MDDNFKQILDYVNADPKLRENTDILVTSDHGFATISRHEIDSAMHVTQSVWRPMKLHILGIDLEKRFFTWWA